MKRSTFSIVLLLGFSLIQTHCGSINKELNSDLRNDPTQTQGQFTTDDKQRGVHLFGLLDSLNLKPFIQNNFDWITMVPWGAQDDFDSHTVAYSRRDSLGTARRDSAWKSQIDIAHAAGFKVSFKPHIWLVEPSVGKWRNDIFPANEDNWKLWKESYREFIMAHAEMAARNNVESFCVGTELTRLSTEKPEFWKSLIQEVRSIYPGKLTYAANWYDEFEAISFWDELDFIGIQAYFPLADDECPSVEEISKGWDKHLPAIAAVYEKYDRKILFTEMGYKSTANSAVQPWEWVEDPNGTDKELSDETQANCYEAFFNSVWNKEWFAGVHLWQMRTDYSEDWKANSLDFTPQGKPAELIIARGFE